MFTKVLKNKKPILILFIHGLIGSEQTWLDRKDGKKSILEVLKDDTQINQEFDIAVYSYRTTLFNITHKANTIINWFKRGKYRNKRNWSIRDIADELSGKLKILATSYENIIIVGHSMGGLAGKQFILDELQTNNPRTRIFITLSTPHNGADLATLGKIVSANAHLSDLAPLSEFITGLNQRWSDNKERLPKRVYFRGLDDNIVLKHSAVGLEFQEKDLTSSGDDHFSILVPTEENAEVVNHIKQVCIQFLNDNGKNPPIAAEEIEVPKGGFDTGTGSKGNRWFIWMLVGFVAVIISMAAYYLLKDKSGPRPCGTKCVVDSLSLTAYKLQGDEVRTYRVPDFDNPEKMKILNNPGREKFLRENVGLPIPMTDWQKFVTTDTLSKSNPFIIRLKFILPKEAVDWAGFVIALKSEIYENSTGIVLNNSQSWSPYPGISNGMTSLVYSGNLSADTLYFKILK